MVCYHMEQNKVDIVTNDVVVTTDLSDCCPVVCNPSVEPSCVLLTLILVEPLTPTDSVIKYSSSILIISPLNDVIPVTLKTSWNRMSWLSVDPIDVGETGFCIILSMFHQSQRSD